MQSRSTPPISAILVTAHRLTRLSAHVTGSTTSPAVWRTLSILRTEGPLRVGALATSSRVSQPTMTKLIAGLIGDGLVSRITDAGDSRASLIAITGAGETALDFYISSIDSALAPLFADLTDTERDTLESAARILQSRAESARAASLLPVSPTAATPAPSTHDRKEEFA